MLNYIWIALLFLGIGAALTTDIINKSENKYRSGIPLNAVIENDTLKINGKYFSSFYSTDETRDILLPAKVIGSMSQKSETPFSVIVNDNSPKLLKEMAASSGDKKDILGKIKGNQVYFEDVSFIKMKDVTSAALDYAATAVNIALGLIGIMALWLGIMKIAESAGLINILGKWLAPITKRLFPEVPSDHPAMGSMIMNISANLLGLGNAATPFGLKAMEELDKLNENKGTATNSMVTFLAINTAGLTLIPASAIAIRAAAGSSDPTIIIGTALFGSACATTAAIIAAKTLQNFNFRKRKPVSVTTSVEQDSKSNSGQTNNIELKPKATVSTPSNIIEHPASTANHTTPGWFIRNIKLLISIIVITALAFLIVQSGIGIKSFIQIFSTLAIPLIIVLFVGYGAIKKVKVYEVFIEGAKEGFNIAIRIIPFLVAMLVAIGIFRAGGAMQWLIIALTPITNLIGMPAEALPMALMRPLSGSGSLGIMAEIISVHGPDSFMGILVSTFYGSTETTFYVLAVYFGAVNIKNTRHAIPAGIIADICGILGALFIVKLLFG